MGGKILGIMAYDGYGALIRSFCILEKILQNEKEDKNYFSNKISQALVITLNTFHRFRLPTSKKPKE